MVVIVLEGNLGVVRMDLERGDFRLNESKFSGIHGGPLQVISWETKRISMPRIKAN